MKKVKPEKTKPSSYVPARTMGIAIITTLALIVALPLLYAIGAVATQSLNKKATTNTGVVKTIPAEELKNAGSVEANPTPSNSPSSTSNVQQNAQSVTDSDRAKSDAFIESQKAIIDKQTALAICINANESAWSYYQFTRGLDTNEWKSTTSQIQSDLKMGRITLLQSDNLMFTAYDKYNKAVNSDFDTYISTVTSKNCTPNVTTRPVPVVWTYH